jgi:RNA recognition motif-containing protein
MGKKLFVGGLAWATTDEGLRQAFSRFGEVTESKVVMDRETGRSRGFGFVSFANEADAEAAASAMNGREIDGRAVRVNPAEEKPAGSRGGFGGGGGGGGRGGFGGGGGGGGGRRDDRGGGRGGDRW